MKWKKKMSETLKRRRSFNGTRTTWCAGDGRVIKVGALETSHLANIIEYLRERAKEDLSKDHTIGVFIPSVNAIEGWLFEHVITYPALREEAKLRGIWDEEKIHVGPKQTLEYVKHDKRLPLDKKVDLLIGLIEELIKQ